MAVYSSGVSSRLTVALVVILAGELAKRRVAG